MVFEQMEAKAKTSLLQSLMGYVRAIWIGSTPWPPMAWSVYNQPVRTNNDVEGWHYRLNRKAQRDGINIYLLFTLLYQEAQMVEVNVRWLSDNKVRRAQRKSAVNGQMKLHKFWQEYRDGTRSISRLLSACARLYAQNPSSWLSWTICERLDNYITIRVFTYYYFSINIVMKCVLFTLWKHFYYLAWIV